MSRYKLVVFDFDGTLADSFPWFVGVLNQVAGRHGFRKVSPSETEMMRGLPNREILDHLGVQRWRLPFIARDMRALSAAAAGQILLFDGVAELLEALSAAGVEIAIVSSNGERTVKTVLGPHVRNVSHFACGASLFGKASKLTGLRKSLKLSPGDVLSIGDEVRDVEAARTAGVDIAVVTWGYATETALRSASPDAIFGSIAELIRHF